MSPRPAAATRFRALHEPGRLLLLANAWDAGSARVVEACGAPAIATTSAGLAWAHGRPDGQSLAPGEVARAVAEIARVVSVPLSVDLEAGYAEDPRAVADHVAAVVDAGAVGINLEDGTAPPERLCAKIEAAREAAAKAGVALFVNARIDVYLRRLAPPEAALAATLERAARYRDAGCDGIFVPLATTPDDLRALVAAVDPLPLNVLARPGLPDAAALRALGVRRLSAGAGLARAALAAARRAATAFLADGRSEHLQTEGPTSADLNALFAQA